MYIVPCLAHLLITFWTIDFKYIIPPLTMKNISIIFDAYQQHVLNIFAWRVLLDIALIFTKGILLRSRSSNPLHDDIVWIN